LATPADDKITIMRFAPFLLFTLIVSPVLAQPVHAPNVEEQRAAMKHLSFLVGNWSGHARMQRAQGDALELAQTENAKYKLDGLVLLIEGTGRTVSDSKAVLQALATISYDDEAKLYRMRAYNNGRYMETEVKLAESGKGLLWGFTFGQIKTSTILAINDKGEWTEDGEIAIGAQPPRKFLELTVRREAP
jgi:hypothetical protein